MCVQHRAWSQKTLEGGNTSLYTVIFAPPKIESLKWAPQNKILNKSPQIQSAFDVIKRNII